MRDGALRAAALAAAAAALAAAPTAHAATTIGESTYPPAQMLTFQVGPGVFAQSDTAYDVPPGGGVITSWTLVTGGRAGFTAPYTLDLLRAAQGGGYTVAARDPRHITTSADGAPVASTFLVRMPVAGGERLGVWDGAAGTMPEGTLGLQQTANTGDGTGMDNNQLTDPPEGTPVTLGVVELGVRLLLSAQVEPDADHDGYGDETQDACPSAAGTHVAPCPVQPGGPGAGSPSAPVAGRTPLGVSTHGHSVRLSSRGTIGFTVTATQNARGVGSATIRLPGGAECCTPGTAT